MMRACEKRSRWEQQLFLCCALRVVCCAVCVCVCVCVWHACLRACVRACVCGAKGRRTCVCGWSWRMRCHLPLLQPQFYWCACVVLLLSSWCACLMTLRRRTTQ